MSLTHAEKIQISKKTSCIFFSKIKMFKEYIYAYIKIFLVFAIIFLMNYSLTTLSSQAVILNSIAVYLYIQAFNVKDEQEINMTKDWKNMNALLS